MVAVVPVANQVASETPAVVAILVVPEASVVLESGKPDRALRPGRHRVRKTCLSLAPQHGWTHRPHNKDMCPSWDP